MAKRTHDQERKRRVKIENDITYVFCRGWDGCGWIKANTEVEVERLLAQRLTPVGFGR